MCRRIFHLCVITAVGIGLCACEYLNLNRRAVEQRVRDLQGLVDNERWSAVKDMMTADFTYTSASGRVYKSTKSNPAGGAAYRDSLKRVKNKIGVFYDVRQVKKKRADVYVAGVVTRIDVERVGSETRQVHWRSSLTWKRVGKDWQLAAVRDLERPENDEKPGQPVRESTVGNDVKSGADYATGNTQMKAKQRTSRKLRELETQGKEKSESQLDPFD